MITTTIEEYISLPKGKTFLRWDIPQPTVEEDPSSHHHLPIFLMLHGATVPNWQFDAIVPHLLENMTFSAKNDDYITAAANGDDIDNAKPNHDNIDTSPNRTSVKAAMDAPTVSNTTSFRPHCILRIDLYGHGRSARPNVEYDLDLFVEQVLGVISELGHSPNNSVNDNGNHESNCNTTTTTSCREANNNFNASIQMDKVKFHTRGMIGIGHSMGAAILSSVAYELATKSKREQSITSSSTPYFRKLILAAPMLDYLSLHPESRLLSIPYIGEKLMHHVIVPKLIDRRRKRYGAIGCADLAERFVREISVTSSDGKELTFPEALLRMFRHGAVGDQSDSYIHLGELLMRYRRLDGRDEGKCVGVDCNEEDGRLKKVHVIWGSRDDVANEDQIYDILGSLGRLRTTCRKDSEEDRVALESRGVTFRVMKGLEHNLLMSHPELCADSIVDALQDNVF